jgi:hypothetical protein
VEGESVNLVVRNPPRTERALVEGLAEFGVSTVHEAQGRAHLLDPALRPIWPGARAAGTAVTVSVPPGDNWMIHVAVEQCAEGGEREEREARSRERYAKGELSLDVNAMRDALAAKGLTYVDAAQ